LWNYILFKRYFFTSQRIKIDLTRLFSEKISILRIVKLKIKAFILRRGVVMHNLLEMALKGDIKSAAKIITKIEDDLEGTEEILKEILLHTGRAHLIGITGPPGVGKSTMASRLIEAYRKKNQKVGVIAVDPSSPFTGGAVLGDRIRMQEHGNDAEGVFIRSMATRGNLGGLSRATQNVAYLMDAMGMEVIIIETVGTGQAEVEIIKVSHTTIVMLSPGMGDAIQALKSGILEIADIFVINKADLEGADDTLRDIHYMLGLNADGRDWEPEVFKTVATNKEGINKLVEGLEKHKQYLIDSDSFMLPPKRRYIK